MHPWPLRKRLALATPCSPPEIVKLLMPEVNGSWFKTVNKTFVGKVSENRLTVRKTIFYRNSFQTCVDLKLKPLPNGGTLLDGYVGVNRYTIWFGMFWCSVVIIAILLESIPSAVRFLSANATSGTGNPWIGIFVPPAMLTFAIAAYFFGRWLARKDETEILAYLQRILKTVPAETAIESR